MSDSLERICEDVLTARLGRREGLRRACWLPAATTTMIQPPPARQASRRRRQAAARKNQPKTKKSQLRTAVMTNQPRRLHRRLNRQPRAPAAAA